ncbi:MAG: hypothetical protein ACWGQW_02715 [bacterium]
MNDKLQRLIDYADEYGVDLGNTEINLRYSTVEFRQEQETRESFRTVKRWVGGFKADGSPPYVRLTKILELNYLHNGCEKSDQWRVKWEGAYECKSKGYDCRPALFSDEAEDHMADIEIEDSQLNI